MPLPTQSTTWSSGANTVSATHSITAAGTTSTTLTINGTAQTTFLAGAQINLEPGFTATADPTATGITFHAAILPPAPITFQSVPAGRSIQVDGTAYTTPITLTLLPGTHSVDASIAQNPPAGTRYSFLSWSDTGSAAHTVTTTSSAAILIANFTTQYQLTTAANPTTGGTVAPPSGWYDSGAAVAIGVTPNSGYLFSSFSGSLTSATTPQSLTMTAPASVTAAFVPDFTIGTPTGAATVAVGATTSFQVNVTGPPVPP